MSSVATQVPFLDLRRELRSLGGDVESSIARVLKCGQFVLGSTVERFEEEFAAYLDAGHCVGVANGQDALELILRAMDLGPDDEVVVPAMTFVATANAVRFAGARLVLCDVGPDGLMDPESLRQAITPQTRAVIPVHLHGQCADMEAVTAVARRHGLRVVEDACQAHGASFRDCRAGTLGDAAAFSFYPTKNLACLGDGGAVVTRDLVLYEKIRLLRNYGSQEKYVHEIAGRNSRLDEIQAAVLRTGLTSLDERNAGRRRAAALYRRGLAVLPLVLPIEHTRGTHVYHAFAVSLACSKERDSLAEHLERNGVHTLRHYPVPIHRQPAYAGDAWPAFEAAERFAATTLSLPMFPTLETEEIDHVVQTMADFW